MIQNNIKKNLLIPKANVSTKNLEKNVYLPVNTVGSIQGNNKSFLKHKISNNKNSFKKENDENMNTQNIIPRQNSLKSNHEYREIKVSKEIKPLHNYQNSFKYSNNATSNLSQAQTQGSLQGAESERLSSFNSEITEREKHSSCEPTSNTKRSNKKVSFIKSQLKSKSLNTKEEKDKEKNEKLKQKINEIASLAKKETSKVENTKEDSNPSMILTERINKATINLESVDSISHNLQNLSINKSLSNDFKPDEYKRMESIFVREQHSLDLVRTLLKDEKPKKKVLQNHKINERMRMRMVDWMIEVINNYKCDESAFFLAVDLMDSYFELSQKCLEPSELHLIGVASMFTASKFQDIYPLRLKMVHEKIAHKKLSTDEIKAKETEILAMNNFKIGSPTIWDFILLFIEEIFITGHNKFHVESERLKEKVSDYQIIKKSHSEIFNDYLIQREKEGKSTNSNVFNTYTTNMINLLKHVALYLAKMNLHDYGLIVDTLPSLLAAATVFVSLKICEQINKMEYLTDCLIKKLCVLSAKPEQSIIKTAQKILANAQNFDSIFNGLENLKKVHFNAIIELKQTK